MALVELGVRTQVALLKARELRLAIGAGSRLHVCPGAFSTGWPSPSPMIPDTDGTLAVDTTPPASTSSNTAAPLARLDLKP